MNDPSVSPAPLVEQALQSLRGNTLGPSPAPRPDAAETQATRVPDAPTQVAPTKAEPAPKPQVKFDRTRVKRDASQSGLDVTETETEADAATKVKLDQARGGASEALRALRTVSVSAQARLADPEAFPKLPVERDLPDLGPYVEHLMREAQAAAAAYREEAARETAARVGKLLGEATASADKIRQDADAYGERAQAEADALLAERVRRTGELTGHLSQMAQRASNDFAGDQMTRDQMTRFISGLTAAAEDAVAELFPNTTSGSQAPDTARAAPRRTAGP